MREDSIQYNYKVYMRPIYETQRDRDNENEAKLKIEAAGKCKLQKLPIAYNADWVALRENKIVAVVEYKRRTFARNKFTTIFIGLDKWMNSKRLAEEIGVPFILFIEWTDGLYYHEVGTAPVTYGIGGRTDRNDPQDIGPVVHIPITAFKTCRNIEE